MKQLLSSTPFNHTLFKRITFSLLITLGSTTSAVYANEVNLTAIIPPVPQIDAQAYILMDYHSGKVLAELNADTRRDPASLTKMMTSYVIGQSVKSGKISLDDKVNISKEAWATGNPVFKGSSLMFLQPGMEVSVADLNRGIIIQSGNDACVAMAEHVAGSQDAFLNIMNSYAQSLGLQNTWFQTVHGLDAPGQYSSARDMALLGQALIRDVPDEYAIHKEKEFVFNKIKQPNRNGLLWDTSLNIDGIKTGHTSAAGYNLVASATEGNMRLISVVMGGKTFKGREADSKKLLTWGFRFFETVTPIQAGSEFASEPVWFGDSDKVHLGVDKNATLTIPRGRISDLKASYTLTESELNAPLRKGQVVGTINFQLDGKTIDQRPLVVLSEIQEGGVVSKIVDYFKLMFHRWFG